MKFYSPAVRNVMRGPFRLHSISREIGTTRENDNTLPGFFANSLKKIAVLAIRTYNVRVGSGLGFAARAVTKNAVPELRTTPFLLFSDERSCAS